MWFLLSGSSSMFMREMGLSEDRLRNCAAYFDLVESTRDRAEWVTKRKGSGRETKLAWTIEDAHAANLVEKSGGGDFRGISRSGKPSNWDKYRRTMLRWRAGTELARAVYPDVTAGIYTPDELADGPAPESLEAPHAAE